MSQIATPEPIYEPAPTAQVTLSMLLVDEIEKLNNLCNGIGSCFG
jgi:hypothetical protein